MSRISWNKESIDNKCRELGIKFLSEDYDFKKNQLFECSCGNKFSRRFSNVLSNNQIYCLECSKKNLAKKNRKRAYDNFNELIEFVNNSGFGIEVLATFDEYKNNKTPLKTRCKCGNIYYPTANSLKRSLNTNCSVCGNKKSAETRRKPVKEIYEFIESESYSVLDYKLIDSKHWIEVGCENELHSPYWVDWGNFYSGNRCPHCNLSKGEERIKRFLISHDINFKREVKREDLLGINNGFLRFDFQISTNENIYYIEYDGEQHFKPKFGEYEFERTLKNDNIKNKYCQDNGLNLLRISYKEFDNIEEILYEYLKIN